MFVQKPLAPAGAAGHPGRTMEMRTQPTDVAAETELSLRVLYSALLPAVRLALAVGVPLKDLLGWAEVAYFHEARRRGFRMREIAERFDISMRKAAQLSKRLKRHFLRPELEHELPRRVEFVLWAGPLSEPRIAQAVPAEDPADVRAALDRLLAEGRVVELEGRTARYAVVRSESRLVRGAMLARIDGLNNLLGSVAHAVYGRFFAAEERAFARTVSLRVRPQDYARLERLYRETIWETLKAMDDAASGAPDAEVVDVSILWAPGDLLEELETVEGHHRPPGEEG